MRKKIILFELNEVPLRIVDEFCRWRPKSCLAQLLPRCKQYETFAEDSGVLSPWITWPSVHRGVSNHRHTISEFGQDLGEVNRDFPPLWEVLARNGISTGVFGSLHSQSMPQQLDQYAFYVPDVFTAGSECFPKKLKAFQEFNLAMTRDSGAVVSAKVHWNSAWRMLLRASELGLRFRTLADTATQLFSERLENWRRIRRRTHQMTLAFDVFMKQLETTLPDFCTFFTNHVASSMHRFWAAAFPQDYSQFGLSENWVQRYSGELDFTMRHFDRMFARLVQFTQRHPEFQLMVSTSMGQAATEAIERKVGMWIDDVSRFMSAIGMSDGEWQPRNAMVPDVNVVVSPTCIEKFRKALDDLSLGGQVVRYTQGAQGFFNLLIGRYDADEHSSPLLFRGERRRWEEFGMRNHRLQDSGQCANHIPQGTLLIYDPAVIAAPASRTTISTLDIAPHIIRSFGIEAPSYMRGGLAADRKQIPLARAG